MTRLVIDLSDVLDEYHDDDAVVVWSPHHRQGSRGQVVNTAQKRIRLTAGKANQEVEPGPLMVKIQCRGLSDTSPKEVIVPDGAWVSLWRLLEQQHDYTPIVVSEVSQLRDDTEVFAKRAEAGADRVGTAENVAQWAEDAEESAKDAGQSASDALIIKNSIPSTVTAELNQRVPPLVSSELASDSTIRAAASQAVSAAADEQISGMTLYLDSTVGTRVMAGSSLIFGETGWRDVTSQIPRQVREGQMLIRRSTSIAYIYFYNLLLSDSGQTYQDFGNFLPTGFYDPDIQYFYVGGLANRGANYAAGAVRISRFGGLRIQDVAPGQYMTGLVSLSVGKTWPSSLPGVPY